MGTGSSKQTDGNSEETKDRTDDDDQGGGQLYVSLKMENHKLTTHLVPHVYGSVPLVGSWDSSKAVILITLMFFFFISGYFFYFANFLHFFFSFLWKENQFQCGSLVLLFHLITVRLSLVALDFSLALGRTSDTTLLGTCNIIRK